MRTEFIFDTHSLVKHLEQSGLNEKQAEGIVHAISESRQFDMANLATKADIALLKQEIAEVKTEIHKAKYDTVKWMLPFLIAIIGLIISLIVQGK